MGLSYAWFSDDPLKLRFWLTEEDAVDYSRVSQATLRFRAGAGGPFASEGLTVEAGARNIEGDHYLLNVPLATLVDNTEYIIFFESLVDAVLVTSPRWSVIFNRTM